MNTPSDTDDKAAQIPPAQPSLKEQLATTNPSTHHNDAAAKENTHAADDERHIGQNTGTGRPPLMKK